MKKYSFILQNGSFGDGDGLHVCLLNFTRSPFIIYRIQVRSESILTSSSWKKQETLVYYKMESE